MKLPSWFKPWIRHKLLGTPRPRNAPKRMHDWAKRDYVDFVLWGRWKAAGAPAATRPRDLPKRVPKWMHELYAREDVREKLKRLGPPAYRPPEIPDLGPFTKDGPSLLDYDMTHATSGMANWPRPFPATDGGWRKGTLIIAPERLEVIPPPSSARRRDGRTNGKAFYARGLESGIVYWWAHLEETKPIGTIIPKGAKVGVTSGNHEEPHAHVAVDAFDVMLGGRRFGKVLEHHTNYTHGAPTIREQFEAALL